ncbi:MAG: hypothetical protein EON87_13625 [Brevundimonas sp.]|nr:MAG: hypothetical protein EON87_13625 [Brevundimonas sp.]
MTRAEVTSGECAAIIWMPSLREERSRAMLGLLLNESPKIESLRQATPGEASDTNDAYLCFKAYPGREAEAVKALKLFIEAEVPDAHLVVLGPFF